MPHRQHLFSLRFAHSLREVLAEGYDRHKLIKDLVSGASVGVIAIPLAMALAIASGVPPQYGLYTAIIAGALIALLGGSRYSISGPTAAFVVILHPLTNQYGLAGLLLTSVMAGVMLVVMAYARLGRLIEYIPEPVTLGFTGGIAIVIAVLQVPDFVGLSITEMPEHFVSKLAVIATEIPQLDIPSTLIAIFTLAVMILWPKLGTPVPPHLPALVSASLLAVVLTQFGMTVDTISSRFHYPLPDGGQGAGIPPYLPTFEWPWSRAESGQPGLNLSFGLITELLPSAFAVAMLGAIESLLCAVVLDGMSGRRHSANSELLAQGIGNIVTPFFGGITATAAIARSATNYKTGAQSPIAAVIHSAVVLVGLLVLAKLLGYIPMPAMAALLLIVAWNMSEAGKSVQLIRKAPPGDVVVLLTCLTLTAFFDMVIAITTGILLASLLFMKELAGLTQVVEITDNSKFVSKPLPNGWSVFKINGPLFFAAADRISGDLAQRLDKLKGCILNMHYTSYLDAGGLAALEKLISFCEKQGVELIFVEWQFQPLRTLAKSRDEELSPLKRSLSTTDDAIQRANELAKIKNHES